MKNFIQKGDTVSFTASGAVVGGKPYLVGALILVAAQSAVDTAICEGHTKGIFELTKVTADAPAEGDIAYLVDGTTNVSTSSASATAMGHFTKAQVNGDTTCEVRLSN